MPNIGPMELIVVLIIALLVLGPRKLPEVGRSVGRGIREFRQSLRSDTHDGEAVELEEELTTAKEIHTPATANSEKVTRTTASSSERGAAGAA